MLPLGGVSEVASTSDQLGDGVDKDERYALNIQDVKMNEDEITTDYPLPSYYKYYQQETNEFVRTIKTNSATSIILGQQTRYKDSYISIKRLELLPMMRPCLDTDVTIFGSGLLAKDDGSSWISLDGSLDGSDKLICFFLAVFL
ncbi:hypothetical protein F2Q68_00046616 [Brassica cretica]|uniref:Uncharacterized protein n=1 Tax=Brassica cretica TaxID=69181 RepID=A0A8S9LQN5_BRACR|nr:hypothetical protein F2Q68_00046616 [Brassica cretica]